MPGVKKKKSSSLSPPPSSQAGPLWLSRLLDWLQQLLGVPCQVQRVCSRERTVPPGGGLAGQGVQHLVHGLLVHRPPAAQGCAQAGRGKNSTGKYKIQPMEIKSMNKLA